MNKDRVEVYFVLDLNNMNEKMKSEFAAQFNSFVNKQKSKQVNTSLTAIVLEKGYNILHDGTDVKIVEEYKRAGHGRGPDVSIDDAICITLSKVMLRKCTNRLDIEASKMFFIVLTNNFKSENTLYSEGEAKAFIEYFKQALSGECYAFGVSDDIKAYASQLGMSKSIVLKKASADGVSDGEDELSIEVPTFLRTVRNRVKNTEQ